MIFRDRLEGGRRLAQQLTALKGQQVVVLGLPRGGVPVAAEVAKALGAPLDVIVVRKLGVPFQPELAMGAVGEGDVLVTNDEVLRMTGVSPQELAVVEARERAEVARRARRFRSGRPAVPVAGRVAVVVDDGIATGATARAACRVARAQGASRVVLAIPVAAADSVRLLQRDADEVVCVQAPERFRAVGEWYQDFAQTTDEEVNRLLLAARAAREEQVEVSAGRVVLAGHLTVPVGARGAVAAVVSRGGRPDLARERLAQVTAPTLLVVGGRDDEVLELNRDAQTHLTCQSSLVVVPGATHLFEEPGALEQVAQLAGDWFLAHLAHVVRLPAR